MSSQYSELSLDQVVESFPTLINEWCEQQHLKTGKNRREMSQLAVSTFEHIFSKDYIRKKIDGKYKVLHRSNNGRKSWGTKLKDRLSSIDNSFTDTLVEGTSKSR